jgi:hypothetical protein
MTCPHKSRRPNPGPVPVPVEEKKTKEEFVEMLNAVIAKRFCNKVPPTPTIPPSPVPVKEKKLDATECKTHKEWVAWNVARKGGNVVQPTIPPSRTDRGGNEVQPKIPPPSRTDWGDNAARFLLRNHPQGLRIVALMLTGNLLPPALLLCHLPRRTTPTTAKISIPLGETTIMVDQGVRGETILGLGLGFGPLDLPPFLTTPTSRIYLLVPMIQDTTVDMTVVHRLVQTMPETEPTMTVTEPTMTKATTEATTEVIRYTLIGLRMSMLTKGRPLDPGEVVQNWITMVATHKTMSPC